VAYLGLCTRLGFIPPGAPAIPELLKVERRRYQDALQEADMAWKEQVLDLGRMETLMEELLIRQLESRGPGADC
jgi:hypothetical protein